MCNNNRFERLIELKVSYCNVYRTVHEIWSAYISKSPLNILFGPTDVKYEAPEMSVCKAGLVISSIFQFL